jgi:hypothetical protein
MAVVQSFEAHREPVGKRVTAAIALSDGTDAEPAIWRNNTGSIAVRTQERSTYGSSPWASAKTVAVASVRFRGAKADEASLTRPLARKAYLRSWRH